MGPEKHDSVQKAEVICTILAGARVKAASCVSFFFVSRSAQGHAVDTAELKESRLAAALVATQAACLGKWQECLQAVGFPRQD